MGNLAVHQCASLTKGSGCGHGQLMTPSPNVLLAHHVVAHCTDAHLPTTRRCAQIPNLIRHCRYCTCIEFCFRKKLLGDLLFED
jgi:hypothetical protein